MTIPVLSANWAGRDAKSLLWLASYPRSGNTFARILLANYVAAGTEAFDINRLHDFIPADASNRLWNAFAREAQLPYGRGARWIARPAFIKHYRNHAAGSPLPALKTHNANVTALGVKAFEFEPGDRVIYLVRHPLDVVLSYSDYNGRDLNFSIEVLCKSNACLDDEKLGLVEVRGSWVEHVSSWLESPSCPTLLVRYVDLTTRTEETLRSILLFLGIPIIEERLRRAVSASHFDKLREQEMSRSFIERPATTRSGRFFREGRNLQWLRQLTPEQAHRLADCCEPMMTKLGYTHPRDVLPDGRNAFGPVTLLDQNLKPDSMRSL